MASKLDSNQILPAAYSDAKQALNVNVSSYGASLTVVDQVIVPFSNINGSGGAKVSIITALAADCVEVQPYDTTGSFLQIFSGPAGASLLCTIGPGQDARISLKIPAGTDIWIRSQESAAPTAGQISLLFLG